MSNSLPESLWSASLPPLDFSTAILGSLTDELFEDGLLLLLGGELRLEGSLDGLLLGSLLEGRRPWPTEMTILLRGDFFDFGVLPTDLSSACYLEDSSPELLCILPSDIMEVPRRFDSSLGY